MSDLKEVISEEEFRRFENVGTAFTALQTNMTNLLRKADYFIIRRACIAQTKTPGGVKLPEDLKTQILMTQNVDKMLDILTCSAYWSWIDVRLLETIVVAAASSQALQLLNNYKNVIFSKKLVDILPHFPGKEVKRKSYTKVVSKIKKDPKEMTVADLLKLQSDLEVEIMDITNGACILESLARGCIEIHWLIPAEYAERAFQSANHSQYKFHDFQIMHLQIGNYPVIQNPLSCESPVMQELLLSEPSATGT